MRLKRYSISCNVSRSRKAVITKIPAFLDHHQETNNGVFFLRKNAFHEEFQKLEFKSHYGKKGSWRIYHIRRELAAAHFRYIIRMQFSPSKDRLPKAAREGTILFDFYAFGGENVQLLKRKIKSCSGYTPEDHVLEEIKQNIDKLLEAYQEEDTYYSSLCTSEASRVLNQLFELGLARYKRGEIFPPYSERYARSQLAIDKVLSPVEIEQANEAQKVINGHSHIEPRTYQTRTGHLSSLNERLETAMDMWDREQKRLAEETRRAELLGALETDVRLRKLVAVCMDVEKEIRTSRQEVEGAHRMFGYTFNLEDYRAVFREFDKLMKEYGLDTYQVRELQEIGRKYITSGGMLPPSTTPYERVEGKFYYADRVHNGFDTFEVKSVGRKYLYTNKGRFLKSSLRHFVTVLPNPDPRSIQDYISNELISLHRSTTVPDAHFKALEEVIVSLSKQLKFRIERRYEYLLEKAGPPEEHKAISIFRNALNYMNLKERASLLKSLAAFSNQPSTEPLLKQIEEMEQELMPYLDLNLLNNSTS